MLQAHKKLNQLLELNLVVKGMRNKLNYNLVGKLQHEAFALLVHAPTKLLDDCTFLLSQLFQLIIFHQLKK